MGQSIRIGRIFGVQIGLHPSWFVIALIVTYTMAAGELPGAYPGWGEGLYWVVGAVISLLFFGSVLAHELSHAVVARRFGLKVRDITLFIFGGAATLEGEPKQPRDEALIAAAGPLTSIAIGAVLFGIDVLVDQQEILAIVGWLGFINITLGLFNLIPGFPMDGGRILRALLWRLRGDRFAATRNAAAVGRLFGYLIIALGVLIAFSPGGLLLGIYLALIGWFLSNAAEAAVAQMSVERSLRGVKVRDVMDPDPPSVTPNESVNDLIHERMLRGEHRTFLVRHDDGGLAGIVTLSDVRRTPREHWEESRVTDIMTRFGDLATVSPDDEVEDALRLLATKGANQLPVLGEGRTVEGLLTRSAITRLIETRLKLGV
jgi:Zn-dependent protease/CBS domain-containing protein